MLVAIDKLDKIGKEGVAKELADKGYSDAQIAGISCLDRRRITRPNGSTRLPGNSPTTADSGLDNLRQIVRLTSKTAAAGKIRIDPSLARGLGYYTGAIMEITVKDLPGSLGGGGRYDNLIGMFLGSDVPACGFSLGLERILVVMQERGMFPPDGGAASVDVVVAAIDESAQMRGAGNGRRAAAQRDAARRPVSGVAKKMDRIFKYVDQRQAKFIAILGSDEVHDRDCDRAKRRDEDKRDDAASGSGVVHQEC